MKIRVLSIILLIGLLLTACQSSGIRNEIPNNTTVNTDAAQKEYGRADFLLDQVLVLMTNEASLQFIDYTPEHFSEVGCVAVVENFNENDIEGVQAALRGENVDSKYDPAKYNAHLHLVIEETDPQGMYRVLSKLMEREDVQRAYPNVYMTDSSGAEIAPEKRWAYSKFSNNAIIVSLTHEASLQLQEYTPEDFSGIGCVQVEEWSPYWLAAIADEKNEDFGLSSYKRRLVLYLENQTREGVYQALADVMQREDVSDARPNVTYSSVT